MQPGLVKPIIHLLGDHLIFGMTNHFIENFPFLASHKTIVFPSAIVLDKNNAIKFNIAGTKLDLSASTADMGEASDSITIDYKGDGNSLEIAFNFRYLLDVLGTIEGENIVIEMKEALTPVAIKPMVNNGHLCIVMPLRIDVGV